MSLTRRGFLKAIIAASGVAVVPKALAALADDTGVAVLADALKVPAPKVVNLQVGTWTHITFVRKSDTIKLYHNFTEVDEIEGVSLTCTERQIGLSAAGCNVTFPRMDTLPLDSDFTVETWICPSENRLESHVDSVRISSCARPIDQCMKEVPNG